MTNTFKLDHNLDNYDWESRCCMGCAMCKHGDWTHVPSEHDFSWICPEWQWGRFDNWGACGRTRLINALLYGDLDYSDSLAQEAAFRCFSCGGCDVSDKRNLDLEILMMNKSLGVAFVDRGYGPSIHKQMIATLERTGNYYGLNQKDRNNWLTSDIKVDKKADTLFFVGCWASFKDNPVAQATARVLNKAHVPFMLLSDETCCGNLTYASGHLEKFKGAAKFNLEKIRALGVKRVVTSCADCYRNLKVEYPKVLDFATKDLGFEVLHSVELVDALVKEGKLKAKKQMPIKATYHDPCSLGRLSEPWIPWEGIRTGGDLSAKGWGQLQPRREFRRGTFGCYEAPRNLIKGIPGVELVEMLRNHSNSYHSGEGGGVYEAYPETAQFAADWRVKEAGLTGADTIITACVHSKYMLSGALPRVQNSIKKVSHVIELVDEVYSK